MCGLGGWFGPQCPQDQERLQAINDTLHHRGPDGQGWQLFSQAGLAHTRLAIVDLAGGAQPMSDASGRYWISYNGEIYNHTALRQQLSNDGWHFQGNSDTEVILALYIQQGPAAFQQLRGMYAFAIWDTQQQRGVLARDPMGIKPLFLHHGRQRLWFASEAKALLGAGACKPALDTSQLHLLLNFRYLPNGGSLLSGISELPAGACWHWHQQHLHKQQIPLPVATTDHSVEHGRELLQQAVKRHMRADVQVGAYLSGGLDSASLCALAKHHQPPTFTLKVGDHPAEAQQAAATANWLGLSNTQQALSTADAETSLRKMLWHLEIPKVNSWQVLQLAGLTAQHVKVSLSGLGADELFYGYNVHRLFYLGWQGQQRINASLYPAAHSALQLTGQLLKYTALPDYSEPARALTAGRQLLAPQPPWWQIYGLLRNVWDSPQRCQQLYGSAMLDTALPDAWQVLEASWPQQPGSSALTQLRDYELKHKLVNDLLWQEDRCSMAVGLESRVPLLDAELVSYATALPVQGQLSPSRQKQHFKKMVQPWLSARIRRRRKSGFQVNSPQLLGHGLTGLLDEYLSSERVLQSGLFNPTFIRQVRRYPTQTTFRWHYFMLYLLLLTELWLEQFSTTRARVAAISE